MDTPICDFIKEYEAKGTSRLHMPGHKGVPFLGCENRDITEICGADELYEAEGIIAASEKNANALFGFGRTIYGTEGSSQCIRTMLFLALQERKNRTERPVILAARNAHKAFLYSCALLDVDVEWLFPEGAKSLCACPITAEQVAEGLKKSSAFAVYITAPDYLGGSPDIKGIAAACRAAGVPLLVDNAHGAYLKFLHPSKHPLDLGAAMSCDSAHKTLPVLTGGAYLHLSAEWAERVGRQAKKAMELFGSTSPSYLILQSLDLCNRYLAEGYREKLQWTIGQIGHLRGQLKKQGWTVMMDSDPLKLTIFTGEKGYRGREVAEVLRAHEVECEFADLDAVVLMQPPKIRNGIFSALKRHWSACRRRKKYETLTDAAKFCRSKKCGFGRQFSADGRRFPVKKRWDGFLQAPVFPAHAAIPIAASGEEITAELLPLFRAYGIEKNRVVKNEIECRERHSFLCRKVLQLSLKFYNFIKFPKKGTKTHCIVI